METGNGLTKIRKALAFQRMERQHPILVATASLAVLGLIWLPVVAGVVTALVWSLGRIDLELELAVRLCVGAAVSVITGRVFIPKLVELAILRYL